MAFFDRAATGVLQSLRFKATGVASGYAVALDGPPDGTRPPSRAVPLTLMVSSTSALATDVEVQVATDAGFTSLFYSNTLLAREDGIQTVTVAGLLDQTRYYWRARAAETGTTGWSPWTAVWSFTPDLSSGKAFGYSNQNIGVMSTPSSSGVWYSDQNIGMMATPSTVAFGAVDENVGVEVTVSPLGFGYAHEGDVSTNTPVPHLWFMKPPSGRPGDGVRIFCFGVGDLQSTYGAVVEAKYPAPRGWQAVPVTGWQSYPPDADAYTAARMLDAGLEHIDMQHQVVEITVPGDALSPGLPIRIRTEGP